MLARGLEQHRKDSSKQIAQPSGPDGSRLGLTGSGQNLGRNNILQPRPNAAVNGAYSTAANPLKRKAGDSHGMAAYKHTSQGVGGVLDALHDSVYFDENDFVDDCDINLDEESPVPLPKAKSALAPPTPTPAATVKYPPLSTSQIEWSSSPIEHKLAAKRQEETQPSLPIKRRKLPWSSHGASNSDAVTEPKLLHKKQNEMAEDSVVYPLLPGATPQSKSRPDETYPWDKTASAVKTEQKQHRKQADLEKKLAKEASAAQEAQEAPAENGVKAKRTATKSSKKNPARVFLSDEQKRVLELIDTQKKSVFFTGSAGTGKSVLMREIIHVLKRRYARDGDRVAVTASTGLAACNIGGVTLHSFSGIGIGKEPVEQLVKKIKKNAKSRNRWLRTKVLIIDEISMVDGALFDKLEEIARTIRNNGRPFGGIQLVVTGDFFQLPPVPDRGQQAKFAFEAATWSTSIQHTIGLTQVFRQKDPEFANILNEMRVGKLTAAAIAKFRSLNRAPIAHEELEATDLFPTRFEVDKANQTRMKLLPGQAMEYGAIDGGTMTDIQRRTEMLQNCMASEKLTLKLGAQVMLIKNVDETLVNGSIGKVIGFMDENTYDYSREHGIEGSFSDGPADEAVAKARGRLAALAHREGSAVSSQKWPLVEFQLPDGTSRELLCVREAWKIEQPSGEVVASRSQVPLILAWALSIHKAQGQTLEKVRVDLGKIFEKGQAYVALSRATTQEGLQIMRFDPKKVMAHPKVAMFYDSLTKLGVQKNATAASPAQRAVTGPSMPRDDSLFLSDDEDAFAAANL